VLQQATGPAAVGFRSLKIKTKKAEE